MPHTSLEIWFISTITSFAGKHWLFDTFMGTLSENDLLKGGIFSAILMALWVADARKGETRERAGLLLTILGAAFSVLVSRLGQNLIPNLRPLDNPEVSLLFPPSFSMYALGSSWNSFPSDHMALFFSLASGVFLLKRSWGVFLMVWSLVVIAFPRVYLGLHYPTDILGGIALGALSLFIVTKLKGKLLPLAEQMVVFADRHSFASTALPFLLLFQIATLFNAIRDLGEFVRSLIHSKI
ncbi:MAG: phosphatase PAP2 family protein [Candidatus Tectomicrobia bacterium]|nr:phosphatase PAP2 family protein [Candidatus Tectomicrobia bacterium]